MINLEDKMKVIVQLCLFAFATLFSVIGFLTVDKLESIKENMKEVKVEVQKLSESDTDQNYRLKRLEEIKNKK